MSESTKVAPALVVAKPSIGLVVGILVLGSSVSIMSTDMYTPSLPDLASWFDTTATRVQLTISLNMLAFGLAQLIHGPLSDRFGRKPVLVVSLFAVAILSLACAAAQSIDQLIVVRILLGLAAAAEAVVGLAIIKDLYSEREQVKAMALLGMVIAVAPAIAPVLGGYIHVVFGWQANFFVISGMAVVALLFVMRLLPESSVPDPDAFKFSVIMQGYSRLLHNSDFLTHTAILGAALGLIFVYVTGAPFVLIEMLGVAADQFGYYQASIVVAFFLGSLLASRLADRWAAMSLLRLGVFLVLTGAAALSLVVFLGQTGPVLLTGTYMIMTFGMGPLFAVAPSRALRSIEGQAGTASAMLSGIEQTMAAAAAVLISLLNDGTARPMALVTIVLAVLLIVLFQRSKREDQLRAQIT
ncbi:multidrug effflux MFS transporter [Granulosicoccus antarcticus]|uniref:Bcr/CflA family efflux transporter n=1 Tax=Granulosicoccus antarcticus IMCC3135 TaxID=1192854 RepID=A0A2Z2NKR4_9GAMM|nr:multidrug effflux MFS transporter [Granulosicoccus antarcticus]ASJ71733.1 Bicyclomycin resistance protein [Granulosicoccus antarcticus IMCC3135]